MMGKGICALIIAGAMVLGACAAQNAQQQDDGFDASICNNIPVGIEAYEAMNPDSTQDKISCADLERCTSLMGWDAPPDVPCTGP